MKTIIICPKFFDYDKKLLKSFSKQLDSVSCFDDRPNNKFLTKVLLRFQLPYLTNVLGYFYFKSILKQLIHNKTNQVILINPEATPEWFLKRLKKYNVKVKLYCWDSFKNKSNFKRLLPHVDKAWSFDRNDCQEYKGVTYLPLFFTITRTSEIVDIDTPKLDAVFIGTLHGDRYDIVYETSKILEKMNVTFKYYIFCPSKVMFYLRKYVLRNWKHIKTSEINFTPLSYSDYLQYLSSSKIVLDIHSSNQGGLTMRTMEAIGLGKKLVTTNKNIVKETFYEQSFISVMDRDKDLSFTTIYELFSSLLSNQVSKKVQSEIDVFHIDNWAKIIIDG